MAASPLLLAEGFFLLKKEPELLKKLTRVEVRIYLWALKEAWWTSRWPCSWARWPSRAGTTTGP